MSRPAGDGVPVSDGGACRECLLHAWLLKELGALLDYSCGEPERLEALLALPTQELVSALGGRRVDQLRERIAAVRPSLPAPESGIGAVCRHDQCYPRSLLAPGSPRLLFFTGGLPRLLHLTGEPLVAILGSRRSSPYGVEAARALARGLAASGATVAASLADDISVAAHEGAAAAGRAGIGLSSDGLAVSGPARRRGVRALLQREGCLISELPPDCNGRRWGAAASRRILGELGQVMVVIEGETGPRDSALALAALQRGRAVAALPGRVTSPLSAAPHSLIRQGAILVETPSDVLDLLHGLGGAPPPASIPAAGEGGVPAELEPALRDVLEQLCLSDGSPDELSRAGRDPGEILFALSELELRGLIVRVAGGRYLARPSRS